MLFIIFSDILMNCVLFAKQFSVKYTKHLKNTRKMEKKILEKSGIMIVPSKRYIRNQ